MVVDERVGSLSSPAGMRLSQVLQDRDELNAVTGGSGDDRVEVRQRRDIGDLVEHDEQWRVERPAGAIRQSVSGIQHLFEQRDEDRPQASLFSRGSAEVEGVA